MSELDILDISRAVVGQAERRAEHVAVVFERDADEPVRLTFADLATRSASVAAAFAAEGIGVGDAVAVALRNEPAFVDTLLALARLGAVAVPIDPRVRGAKLSYFLNKVRCAAVVAADSICQEEEDVIRGASRRTWSVETPDGLAGGASTGLWAQPFAEALHADHSRGSVHHVGDPTMPWSLAYTSGTTGDPKAVVVPYARFALYRALPQFFGYRPDDVTYTGLSLTHGNAQVVSLFPALHGDVDHVVLSAWFTRRRLWEICARHGVTTWSNLGGLATGVYSQAPGPHDRAHRVRLVVSAGMPAALWPAFEERFGVEVLEWYGSVEGGFAFNPPGVGPVGSFGRAPAGLLDMEVHDEEGRSVPAEAEGELVVRPSGGSATLDYLDDPEASASKVRDGWLRTGDLVHADADGWLYFHRRREEGELRRQGEFVAEGFVRRAIAEAQGITDVHVYGLANPAAGPGEVHVVAAIVTTCDFDMERLAEHCGRRLEKSHLPDFIQIVDELPTTPSGKVVTRLLEQRLATTESVAWPFPREVPRHG